MRYINKEDKEDIIFKCECGQYSFIQFGLWDLDIKPYFYIEFIERPYNFWGRLSLLFRRRDYTQEILLSEADIKCLIKFLNKKLKQSKGQN